MNLDELAKQVLEQAKACDVTIVTAESCTAGLVAHTLSKVPGAGDQLAGGFITYTKEMKAAVLGVSPRILQQKSAVCGDVAYTMALGALNRAPASLALAVTGVAGPEPDEDGNPVGLIYLCALRKSGQRAMKKLELGNESREEILAAAVAESLNLLKLLCSQ